MTQQNTEDYAVKMFGGQLGGAGEGVYFAVCHRCIYRTKRYRFSTAAESDVQEHLWRKHSKTLFRVAVKA